MEHKTMSHKDTAQFYWKLTSTDSKKRESVADVCG